MAELGALAAMAELGALEAMAEPGALEAMAELGAQEAMVELGAQEAMADGLRGLGLGPLSPAPTAGTHTTPPQKMVSRSGARLTTAFFSGAFFPGGA